ncbi:MAG: alpha-amylase family glycosyl hydrolase [Planctomycetia bacterium]|nr:alpha-amylase family glycosyl hydrolase [Planctomycetia bacterium]
MKKFVFGSFVLFCMGLTAAMLWGAEENLHEKPARQAPEWLTKGIIYQINPRAFTPEGTLKAIEAKLPHIQATGATIVYLCPVFMADDDMDRKYWSTRQKSSKMENPRNPYRIKDYYNVDPEYGTNEDLKSLIQKAHERGLRVMLDMVYFHCGPTAIFLEEHPDFVLRDKEGNFETGVWAFPKLNFQSQALREYLYQNMEMWVRDYDVDGFRCDVADLVPLDFWEEGRRRLEKIRPDVAMICEGIRPKDQLYAFDMSYGFQFYWALQDVYDKGKPALSVRQKVEEVEKKWPQGARFMHYVDNHDIANGDWPKRRGVRWGEKGMNAALVLCYTMDGTPMLYCGLEMADKCRHSIFGKTVYIDWNQQNTDEARRRMAFCQELAKTRLSRPELTEGKLVWLDNSTPDEVLSFARVLGDTKVLVVINFRDQPIETNVKLADGTEKTFSLAEFGYVIE